MSYTELYAVNKKGDVEFYDEVKNSWAGGMHVWNTLNEKYNLKDSMFTQYRTTWGKFNKGFYEKYEDMVLGSTFDGCVIKKENFNDLIKYFNKYTEETTSSNLDKQIEIIENMKSDENVIGVAWCQTSVANDAWDYGYDEEEEEVIPYNINKGDKHWFLFEELED